MKSINHQPLIAVPFATVLLVAPFTVFASEEDTQNVFIEVREIAELSIFDPGGPVLIIGENSTAAGDTPSLTGNNLGMSRLHYTSVVPDGRTRSIMVALQDDSELQQGMNLQLQIGGTSGTGATGTSQMTNATNLSMADQVAISGIGTAATGTGGFDGAQLLYSMDYDFEHLRATEDSIAVTVVYTIVADN